MNEISMAITSYNRVDVTLESFIQVLNDKRISEFVICDDFSDINVFELLKTKIELLKSDKVKIYRNYENLGVSRNKEHTISLCENDWVIIFDSDNVIDKSYIDKLFEIDNWSEDTIYCPDVAGPFDYKSLDNLKLNKYSVVEKLDSDRWLGTLLNTGNYFVNKKKYIEVYSKTDDFFINKNLSEPVLDCMNFSYFWLKDDLFLYVVENLKYNHRMSSDSDYIKYHETYGKQVPLILEKIKKLI